MDLLRLPNSRGIESCSTRCKSYKGPKIFDTLHGELEVFHSLYNVYCPKRLSFSYEGMYARTQLAVMDNNSGVGRQHAKTKEGIPRYNTVLSKVSSQWVAKRIMEDKEKTFIKDILSAVWRVSELNMKHVSLEKTPKNLSTVEYPGKAQVIMKHTSRFSK